MTACVANTGGGLVAGDRLSVSVTVVEGARAMVMAQAAEKVYRSGTGDAAEVSVSLTAGAESWLEWLPRETIVFDRARLRRETVLNLDPTAHVLAGEIVVLGRRAHGETLTRGLIRDTWAVRISGRLVWADALHLEGDLARAGQAPAGFAGAEALATLIARLPGQEAALTDAVRTRLETHDRVRAGCTTVNGLMICRILAPATVAALGAFADVWTLLRQAGGGHAASLPRLWSI
nr:urease accessory protein UreD [Roseospira navarrensis]